MAKKKGSTNKGAFFIGKNGEKVLVTEPNHYFIYEREGYIREYSENKE